MEATHSKHNRTRNAQNIAPTTRPWQTAHLHLPFIDCQQLQDIRTQPASQRCVQGEEGQLHTSRLWGLHVYLRWRVGGHDWHIWGEGKIFIPISMMQGPQGHLVVHALFDYIIQHMVNICGRCPKKQPHKHTPRPMSGGGSYVLCIPCAVVFRVGCLHIAYQGDRVMRACSHGLFFLKDAVP